MKVKIASIQFEYKDSENISGRLRRVEDIIDNASGSDLFLLPEIWSVGFFNFDAYKESSQYTQDPIIKRLGAKAKKLKAYILAGSLIENDDGHFYNTIYFINREGDVQVKYRKIHLYSYIGQEKELLSPGKQVVSTDTDFGRVGFAICYDIRFPELFRSMSDKGVELIQVVSCWPHMRIEPYQHIKCARAAENLAYLVSCNATGENNGIKLGGRSHVVDPFGFPIAQGNDQEMVIKTEIDMEYLRKVRKDIPFLREKVLH